jgi:plasmid maintenance system antidote protein VapI
VVKNVDAVGLRIARLAYVMHYSLGTLAHMMRTRRLHARLCARLEKVFGRANMFCDYS